MNSVTSIPAVQSPRGFTIEAPREVTASAGERPNEASSGTAAPRPITQPAPADASRFTTLTAEEREQVQSLKARDTEVRAHEQAHKNAAGQYAGAISYEFQTGPDGNRYAIGGEVPIDVSREETPEATINKMQIVIAAALAPAEPSPEDRAIASQAQKTLAAARNELLAENREERLAASTPPPSDPDVASTEAAKSYNEQIRATTEPAPTDRGAV